MSKQEQIVIVFEDDTRWNVQCAEEGCERFVTVPKAWTDHHGERHTQSEPTPVRCVSHPPKPLPKVQQITAAVDAAVPYVVGFHNTGGGCHAIRVEVGDYQHDDFREVMITDVDVFSIADWDTDEHLCGEFWVGAYDGSGDPIGEESLIVVPDDGDFTAVVLPKIVDAVRTQIEKVEAQPKPTPDRDIDGTPEHDAAHGEAPRTYVVGLPVVATINADGFITVEVDLSELGSRKALGEHSEYADETIAVDAEALAAWAKHHVVQNAGYTR